MSPPFNPSPPNSSSGKEPATFAQVPDHELIRMIGSGSSGQIWLARSALGTLRAVKIVYEHTFRHRRPYDREFNGVLKTEPFSRLHDGLVDILQVGRNDAAGYFYCVMELADDVVAGRIFHPDQYTPRTLAHEIGIRKRLSIQECLLLSAQIASALGFLHKNGLIHRDIKPSNIIFVDGIPKLADIGSVAEISEARSYVGTEGFIPPEGPGTAQADIYSLGKVLYELSTGKDRNDYPELPANLNDTADDRDLINLNKIVLKACRMDSGQRFRTADEMVMALHTFKFCVNDPIKEEARRKWTRIMGVAGALVATLVVLILLIRLISLLKNVF